MSSGSARRQVNREITTARVSGSSGALAQVRFAGIYDKDEAERIVENTAYTAERQPERDITPVNDETMQEINTLLIALDKTWDDDLLPLCSQIFRRDIRASSELTQAEAVKALGFLKQKATEQKVAA